MSSKILLTLRTFFCGLGGIMILPIQNGTIITATNAAKTVAMLGKFRVSFGNSRKSRFIPIHAATMTRIDKINIRNLLRFLFDFIIKQTP